MSTHATSTSGGRAVSQTLVVGTPAGRAATIPVLQQLGYACNEADDPYAAMAELCRRPGVYRAVVLSLQSLYREELAMIPAVKQGCRYVEVWVTEIEGRSAALAEAMRLGADALLNEEGLHHLATGAPPGHTAARPAPHRNGARLLGPAHPAEPATFDEPSPHAAPQQRPPPDWSEESERPVARVSPLRKLERILPRRANREREHDVAEDAIPTAPLRPAAREDEGTHEHEEHSTGEEIDALLNDVTTEPVLTAEELRALLQEQPNPEGRT